MKIAITGGHLSPALSVIDRLKNEQVLLIGRKYATKDDKTFSAEHNICKELNIPFGSIRTARLQRSIAKSNFASFLNLPVGTIQSLSILKKFKPNVVLGFGGYVSLPVVFAARILKIPVVIHEQTLEAGVANKIASKFATKVCISWKSSEKFFPKSKTIITGNPLRSIFLEQKKEHNNFLNFKDKNLPIIYVTGGSLGSHAINSLVNSCLKEMLNIANVIHQTGDSKTYLDFDNLSNLKEALPKKLSERFMISKFIGVDDLIDIYKKADLVISRSGINTITELIYFKKPALLIPLPIGQKNEQLKNALFYKSLGLANIGIQSEITPDKFLNLVKYMLDNKFKYEKVKIQNGLIDKNASEKIIKVLRDVTKK